MKTQEMEVAVTLRTDTLAFAHAQKGRDEPATNISHFAH